MRFSHAVVIAAMTVAALLVPVPATCHAGILYNVPVGSRVYTDLELLELRGVVESGMLSTRPFSRIEAARLVREASARLERSRYTARGAERSVGIVRSLEEDFRTELDDAAGGSPFVSLDPSGPLEVTFTHAGVAPYFADRNNNGDHLVRGSNTRARAEVGAALFNHLTISATPEYRLDDTGGRGELLAGYAAVDLWGLTIEAGRESMWWGPGYHGDLLVTNNARPFDLVKLSTLHPVAMPWIFSRLGLLKPTVFLTRLEGARAMPHANLLGMRLDFKPLRSFGFSLNRVFMFGGDNRPPMSSSDWFKVFFVSDDAEHRASPINGNQLASIDAYYVYVNRSHRYLPFSGLKVYTEWGAEDSSGKTKTPSNRANLYGVLIDGPLWLSDTDLRVEWANTARRSLDSLEWYKHDMYRTGYTYEGDYIGHHMGSDSRDLFIRVNHRISASAAVGFEADFETNGVHKPAEKTERTGLRLDLSWRPRRYLSLVVAVGYEEADSPVPANDYAGYVSSLGAELSF